MKRIVPNWIKFSLWWLFKSPQRKLGWFTLTNDLIGLFRYLIEQTPFKNKPHSVSICVGIYNRQETFLQHFLPSLTNCLNQELIELSIFDCGSVNHDDFKKQVALGFNGKLVFNSESHPFARAFAFNRAVKQATHDLIFLCDADFSLPKKIVQLCSSYTKNGEFWFPIVYYLYKNKPAKYAKGNGEWMLWGGKGLLACNKKSYLDLGGLNEEFKTWGGEDEDFWLNCHASKKVIIRTKEKELLHHWHASHNLKYKKLEELSDLGIL